MSTARGPQRWQWVLTATIAAGSVAGGIASNILADVIDRNLGAVTWITGGLATVIAGVLATLEVRNRRAEQVDRAAEPAPAVPVQEAGAITDLPYTSGFVGRRLTVQWLADAITAEHVVALIGRRAVGTSACVVEAANQVRDRFPGGQLYLDLRRPDRALSAREVVDALRHKIGIDDPAPDLETAAAQLRAAVGEDRKILLVLDNVDSPEQVSSLLPPARECRLLLAGGPALAALENVRVRQLIEPSTGEAVELFTAAARDAGSTRRNLPADPAVRDIVELAGRQPQAVRVLGSWLARRGWSARELLAALQHGARSGRIDPTLARLAARDRAYDALSPGARRLVRLLTLARQPLSRNAVAALTGTNRGRAERMLDEAAEAAFVAVTPDGRYRLRTLLVRYTAIHLQIDEPPRRRLAAQGRLVRYLGRQAERHADAIPPGEEWFGRHEALLRTLVCDPWGTPGAMPAGPPRRMRRWWLRLAVALCTWYAAAGRLDDWAAVCRAVLDSPLAGQTASVAGWAHNELGAVRRWQGNTHEAAIELTAAVALRHRRGAAQSRTNLGLALLDQGDVDGAVDQLQRARRQRSPSDRTGQALTELGLGSAYLARDEPGAARHHLIRAANAFEAIGDRKGYAAALTNLGLAQWWLGERLDAAQAWSAALDCHPGVGDPHGHAVALLNAGAILLAEAAATGSRARVEQARELLRESLEARLANGWPTGRTLLHLGDAATALGDSEQARRLWQEAADACDKAADEPGAAAARSRLS